jgi:outer membrane receptor protein involved in Fe transport
MSLRFLRTRAGVVALSLILAPAAGAQSLATPQERNDSSVAALGTTYVVTKAQIVARGYAALSDVLRDLPGMETVEQYFSEVGTAVGVRGFSGNNAIVLLVNGMRVNPPGDEELMLRRDVSVRGAERVEVRYGPGSLTYGQNAVSAVIDIITGTADARRGVEAVAALGTLGTAEGWIQFATRLGGASDTAIRISGFAQRSRSDLSRLDRRFPEWWKGYAQNARAYGLPDAPARQDDATNLFVRVENGGGSVQAWYRESSRSSAEGGLAPVLQFVPQSVWHDRSLVVEGRHESQLTAPLRVSSSITWNRYEVDPETRYVFPVNGSLFLNDFKYALGSSTTLEQEARYTVSSQFTLTGGATASFYEVTPKATIPGGARTNDDVVRQAGVLSYYTRRGDATSRVDVPRATHLSYRGTSGYVQARYQPTRALQLLAGGRVDDNTRFKDTPLSTRADIVFSPDGSRLTYHVAYAQGFVAPGPYYGYNVYDNGIQINTVNPDLQTQRARSYEGNVSWRSDGVQVTTSAYVNRQSNLFLIGDLLLPANIIARTVYSDAAGGGQRLLTRTVNGGERTVRGVDVSAQLTRSWGSAWASYSTVAVSSASDAVDSTLAGLSAHNLRLGATLQLLRTLSVTPSVSVRSTPEGIANPGALASALQTPYEVNASVRYMPTPRWVLFLQGRNLTDHAYALRGVLTPAPQEGRVVVLGVQMVR